MRIRGTRRVRLTKAAAITASVALTFFCAAWPAVADTPTTTDPEQAGPSLWEPPAPDLGLAAGINTTATPDGQFVPNVACVQPGKDNQTLNYIPPAQKMLNLTAAQAFSTGKGQTVAVIDTGVNPHPFFQKRLTGGGDFVQAGGTGTDDCDGHGTMTAGIIAANPQDSSIGFIGVAPDANIVAIRQTSQTFKGTVNGTEVPTAGDATTLAEAIMRAVNVLHATVITTSVDICQPTATAVQSMNSVSSGFPQLEAAIAYAYFHNVVVVNSAGNIASVPDENQNSQQTQQGPCTAVPQNTSSNPNDVVQVEVPAVFSQYLLSVASVNPTSGAVSTFSVHGPWVNIAAPGEEIVTVDPGQGGTGLANEFAEPGGQGGLETIQGTSFAAPYVAGVAALVRAKYPNLSAAQVIQRLEYTAQHPSGAGGRNNEVGYGIVDPVAALTADVPGQNGVPMATGTSVPAQLPQGPNRDWLPIQVALIGSVGGVAALVVTLFIVRTRRRNAERAAS